MARVLGTAWKEKCLSGFFFFGESQHVSARKDSVVTQPNLCCPKEDKPKGMSLSTWKMVVFEPSSLRMCVGAGRGRVQWVHFRCGHRALQGRSPWPSAARAHGKGSCLRMAGSSSGRLHCSQAGAPQRHSCHSWRWENFPESDAETQETVNERAL